MAELESPKTVTVLLEHGDLEAAERQCRLIMGAAATLHEAINRIGEGGNEASVDWEGISYLTGELAQLVKDSVFQDLYCAVVEAKTAGGGQ